jgi:hypothetical protein
MKQLLSQLWAAVMLAGIFLAWIAYGLWCLITGQPIQPMN